MIKGSDTVQSVLNLGISSILARNVLLQVVAGVGLTDELPDYSFTVSLPITFSITRDRGTHLPTHNVRLRDRLFGVSRH